MNSCIACARLVFLGCGTLQTKCSNDEGLYKVPIVVFFCLSKQFLEKVTVFITIYAGDKCLIVILEGKAHFGKIVNDGHNKTTLLKLDKTR